MQRLGNAYLWMILEETIIDERMKLTKLRDGIENWIEKGAPREESDAHLHLFCVHGLFLTEDCNSCNRKYFRELLYGTDELERMK